MHSKILSVLIIIIFSVLAVLDTSSFDGSSFGKSDHFLFVILVAVCSGIVGTILMNQKKIKNKIILSIFAILGTMAMLSIVLAFIDLFSGKESLVNSIYLIFSQLMVFISSYYFFPIKMTLITAGLILGLYLTPRK